MRVPNIVYDEAKFQKLYDELHTYSIPVPENLMSAGFHEIAGLMFKVQAAKDRVTSMLMEVGPIKSKAEMQSYLAKEELESKLSSLMDLDQEVMNQSSDTLRKAKASQKLKEEKSYMIETRSIHKLIVAYTKAAENILKNLESKAEMLTEASNMLKRMQPPPVPNHPVQNYPGQPDPRMPSFPPKSY